MEMYTEYVVPMVLLACLVTGYILKKWVADLENKYIPTILAVLGAVLNAVNTGMSLEAVIYGALTGLASTGMHQAFTAFIDNQGGAE